MVEKSTVQSLRWAGFATAKVPYEIKRGNAGTYWQFVERSGERPEEWSCREFLSTTDCDEVEALTLDFPKRWHVEEFFNAINRFEVIP